MAGTLDWRLVLSKSLVNDNITISKMYNICTLFFSFLVKRCLNVSYRTDQETPYKGQHKATRLVCHDVLLVIGT